MPLPGGYPVSSHKSEVFEKKLFVILPYPVNFACLRWKNRCVVLLLEKNISNYLY